MKRFSTSKDNYWMHEPVVLARLEKHASAAIPEVRKLFRGRHAQTKLYAAGVLACIDPESRTAAFKVLAPALQEPDKSDLDINFLTILGPEATPLVGDLVKLLNREWRIGNPVDDFQIFNLFTQIGAKAKPAIPQLTTLARYTYAEREAEEAFLAIGPVALDALIKSLKVETASPRIVHAIARFGSKAEKAIPVLIAAVSETDSQTRISVADALGTIHSLSASGRSTNC